MSNCMTFKKVFFTIRKRRKNMIDQEIIFNYLVEQLDLGELQWIYNILKKEDNKGCSN